MVWQDFIQQEHILAESLSLNIQRKQVYMWYKIEKEVLISIDIKRKYSKLSLFLL
jgi:hypothetical protein